MKLSGYTDCGKMVKGLYLYRAFLVLMTTQSALQYSSAIQPFPHTFIQCIYGQHFVFPTRVNLRFSILTKDPPPCRWDRLRFLGARVFIVFTLLGLRVQRSGPSSSFWYKHGNVRLRLAPNRQYGADQIRNSGFKNVS